MDAGIGLVLNVHTFEAFSILLIDIFLRLVTKKCLLSVSIGLHSLQYNDAGANIDKLNKQHTQHVDAENII